MAAVEEFTQLESLQLYRIRFEVISDEYLTEMLHFKVKNMMCYSAVFFSPKHPCIYQTTFVALTCDNACRSD